MVVRGGVEPPTFRFSEGFAGPGMSITSRLTGPYAAPAPSAVQAQPHVSTAVVSKALARSAGDNSCHWRARLNGLRQRPSRLSKLAGVAAQRFLARATNQAKQGRELAPPPHCQRRG